MVREWSFFFDAILKAFSGKISNYDAVTFSMLDISYMFLSDSFYNIGSLILYELGAKLGNKASRSNNIYYAKCFMLLANCVEGNLVIQFLANSKECWVQNKIVFEFLNRLNHNKEVQLVYPPIFNAAQEAQASQVNSSTVPTSIVPSLISSATMEAGIVQQPPTQVATYRISKSKSRKPTSGASQKALVVKTTQTLEGSVKEVISGEGRDEHQRNPKNKEVASSQKDVAIENSPQPGTQYKRDRDTRSPTDTSMTYTRRKRSRQSRVAQGTHTVSMTPSQIQFDVAPVNVESQPHSLSIQTETETPSL
ncbi:hypothetical protein POM88_035404 [Heracleum sosnowskyi]|uniref:Uncharacterized protein n=1 Tax=Heracleum sosnowskyi TaxID=360622 RepID=A0AAD8HNA6_9APIA|nr:hypothetical protein POM88_035404 [Heracleum sosnowskyi]